MEAILYFIAWYKSGPQHLVAGPFYNIFDAEIALHKLPHSSHHCIVETSPIEVKEVE